MTSSIHSEARSGHLVGVRRFLQQGVAVDTLDTSDRSALYLAAGQGHGDIVRLLLNKGANVNSRNRKKHFTPLFNACQEGHLEVAKVLVQHGAELDAPSSSGETPFLAAVKHGHLKTVQFLCSNGCDIHAKIANGRNAYHIAAEHGHVPIMSYLESRGIGIESKDDNDATPLMVAKKKIVSVKHLLSRGVCMDAVSVDGKSALHYAADRGTCQDVMACLVESGCNLNMSDVNGRTPLHYVCMSKRYDSECGQADAARTLIQAGAQISVVDHEGKRPVDYITGNATLGEVLKTSATPEAENVYFKESRPVDLDISLEVEKAMCSEKATTPAESAAGIIIAGGASIRRAESSKHRRQKITALFGPKKRWHISSSQESVVFPHEDQPYIPRHPKKACAVYKVCCEFVTTLKLSVHLFEPNSDRCYCDGCFGSRGKADWKLQAAQKYALPVGWTRFGLKLPQRAARLQPLKTWHRAYHGTEAGNLDSILTTDILAPSGSRTLGGKEIRERAGHFHDAWKPEGFDTKQVFVTPSPNYAELYARAQSFTSSFTNKTYRARTALALLISPNSYTVGPETMGLTRQDVTADPRFANSELEWATKELGATMFYGLLIKMEEVKGSGH